MITGFEPRTSGVRKNHSTTKVTTTAQRSFKAGRFRTFYNCIKQSKLLSKWQLHVTGFFCVDSTALPKYRTAKVPHCQSTALPKYRTAKVSQPMPMFIYVITLTDFYLVFCRFQTIKQALQPPTSWMVGVQIDHCAISSSERMRLPRCILCAFSSEFLNVFSNKQYYISVTNYLLGEIQTHNLLIMSLLSWPHYQGPTS